MNTDEIKARLISIRDAANAACGAAYAVMDQIDDAVNWDDLGAYQARFWIDENGATGYEVTIEEVSPQAAQFAAFIRDHLAAAGFPDVEVRCEW